MLEQIPKRSSCLAQEPRCYGGIPPRPLLQRAPPHALSGVLLRDTPTRSLGCSKCSRQCSGCWLLMSEDLSAPTAGKACSLADEPVFAMIAPNFVLALSFLIQLHRQAALDVVPRGIWRHIQCPLRPLAPRRSQHSHRCEFFCGFTTTY